MSEMVNNNLKAVKIQFDLPAIFTGWVQKSSTALCSLLSTKIHLEYAIGSVSVTGVNNKSTPDSYTDLKSLQINLRTLAACR